MTDTSRRHEGRVAIVTGVDSGLGQATAITLAAEGAAVIGCDVAQTRLDETGAQIRSTGGSIELVLADVSRQDDVDGLVGAAASHGPIDVLANVAGILDRFLPVGEIGDEMWDRVLAVNLTGPMRLCRAIVPRMVERGGGAIVNVASASGIGHISAGAAYAASKAGLVGLTRSVSYLYARQGVRCNAVCPAGIPSGMEAVYGAPWVADIVQPSIARLPRMGEAPEVAAAISWLASDEASYVNGAVLTVDGGFTAG